MPLIYSCHGSGNKTACSAGYEQPSTGQTSAGACSPCTTGNYAASPATDNCSVSNTHCKISHSFLHENIVIEL